MRLYDLARTEEGIWIWLLADKTMDLYGTSEPVLFYYVDGMFSYCKDRGGQVIHPRATSKCEIIGEGEVE